MNRRHFLRGLLIGGAVAAVPDPIRSYFFAPAGGWQPETITPAMMRAITAPLCVPARIS